MESKIHILGSCATRDPFRILNQDQLVGRYTSRSSLISRFSAPLIFDFHAYFNTAHLDWKQKMLQQDFAKNGLFLDDYATGILIIDFIDERFDLLKISNTWITKSTAFVESNLEKAFQIQEILKRGELKDFDLWTDACFKFTQLMPEAIRENTILHRAFWVTKYLQDGVVYDFEDQNEIRFFNYNLTQYYNTFESIYAPGYVMEIAPKKRLGDANHVWGKAPFHYTHEYYEEFYQQVIDIQATRSI